MQEVIHLIFQICYALVHLEKNNVIHRDIKTKNIFITQNNTFKLGLFLFYFILFYFILGDFSVSRIPGMSTQTIGAGTNGYIAPEVLTGEEFEFIMFK
jgi:serine/threonine protein kinase